MWFSKRNLKEAIIGGHKVVIKRSWGTSFSKTGILEYYGEEKGQEIIDNCGRRSESVTIELQEIKDATRTS